jgi:hypothetical protein
MLGTSGITADMSNATYVNKLKAVGKSIEITDGSNTITNGIGNLIVGNTNTITQDKYNIVVGTSNSLTGVGAPGSTGSLVIGAGNNLGTYGFANIVVGGYNAVSNASNFRLGNNGNTTGSNTFSMGEGMNMFANHSFGFGVYHTINTEYSHSFGNNNDITGTGSYNNIWGGKDNVINNKTYASMIGCSGRTASASTTTYVENIHAFRTPSTEVQPVLSGTVFTCNLELGGKSQFYITGTSTINITNVRDGASFMIKTQTDGNYVMTWTALDGYTFLFEGGLKDPGNTTIDLFVFEVFGSVIYGSRRHNFS